MVDFYRPLIKNVLRESCPGHTEDEYEALSWSGLQHTDAWLSLESNIQDFYREKIYMYKRK